jgi:hypothetical protein
MSKHSGTAPTNAFRAFVRRRELVIFWYTVFLVFGPHMINPTGGPLGEEPGWRGFAQPRLQSKRSLLVVGSHPRVARRMLAPTAGLYAAVRSCLARHFDDFHGDLLVRVAVQQDRRERASDTDR